MRDRLSIIHTYNSLVDKSERWSSDIREEINDLYPLSLDFNNEEGIMQLGEESERIERELQRE